MGVSGANTASHSVTSAPSDFIRCDVTANSSQSQVSETDFASIVEESASFNGSVPIETLNDMGSSSTPMATSTQIAVIVIRKGKYLSEYILSWLSRTKYGLDYSFSGLRSLYGLVLEMPTQIQQNCRCIWILENFLFRDPFTPMPQKSSTDIRIIGYNFKLNLSISI